MRRKLGWLSLAGLVLFYANSAIHVDAGIRPSFGLDGCPWFATHIVLVQTTPEDGVFSVVESWKGNLEPGYLLDLPELRPSKEAVKISNPKKPKEFNSVDAQGISEQIPRQRVGSQPLRVFGEAAGKDSGKLLHARLQLDLIYWKAVGPTLTPNWYDQLSKPGPRSS